MADPVKAAVAGGLMLLLGLAGCSEPSPQPPSREPWQGIITMVAVVDEDVFDNGWEWSVYDQRYDHEHGREPWHRHMGQRLSKPFDPHEDAYCNPQDPRGIHVPIKASITAGDDPDNYRNSNYMGWNVSEYEWHDDVICNRYGPDYDHNGRVLPEDGYHYAMRIYDDARMELSWWGNGTVIPPDRVWFAEGYG